METCMGLFQFCFLFRSATAVFWDNCKPLTVSITDVVYFASLGVGEDLLSNSQIDTIDFNCFFFVF